MFNFLHEHRELHFSGSPEFSNTFDAPDRMNSAEEALRGLVTRDTEGVLHDVQQYAKRAENPMAALEEVEAHVTKYLSTIDDKNDRSQETLLAIQDRVGEWQAMPEQLFTYGGVVDTSREEPISQEFEVMTTSPQLRQAFNAIGTLQTSNGSPIGSVVMRPNQRAILYDFGPKLRKLRDERRRSPEETDIVDISDADVSLDELFGDLRINLPGDRSISLDGSTLAERVGDDIPERLYVKIQHSTELGPVFVRMAERPPSEDEQIAVMTKKGALLARAGALNQLVGGQSIGKISPDARSILEARSSAIVNMNGELVALLSSDSPVGERNIGGGAVRRVAVDWRELAANENELIGRRIV